MNTNESKQADNRTAKVDEQINRYNIGNVLTINLFDFITGLAISVWGLKFGESLSTLVIYVRGDKLWGKQV